MDTTHLVALSKGLSNEKQRLLDAKTAGEREIRSVWVKQLEREVANEMKYLGMSTDPLPEISDDDLLKELM